MKKVVKFTFFLLISGLLFQISCKKDKSGDDSSGSCYITTLAVMQFAYTPANKIEYVLAYDFSRYPMDTIITYKYNSSTGRLAVIQYDPGSSSIDFDSILYDGTGRVAFCKSYQNGTLSGTATYKYNSSNQIIEVGLSGYMIKKYSSRAPLISATVTFEYDANGNVRKEILYSGSQIIESYEYEYDKKRNPYHEWNLPEGFGTFNFSKLISKNNYVKEIYFYDYSNETTTTSVTYTYNSRGYPTLMTFKDESGEETYGAQYNCKD
jgi:hypothetical protein